MNTYYLVADSSSNTGKEYISEDHSNTGDETSAKLFKTEDDAKDWIKSQGFGDWAYVTTMETKEEFDI